MSGFDAVAPSEVRNARRGDAISSSALAAEPDPEGAVQRAEADRGQHERADDAERQPDRVDLKRAHSPRPRRARRKARRSRQRPLRWRRRRGSGDEAPSACRGARSARPARRRRSRARIRLRARVPCAESTGRSVRSRRGPVERARGVGGAVDRRLRAHVGGVPGGHDPRRRGDHGRVGRDRGARPEPDLRLVGGGRARRHEARARGGERAAPALLGADRRELDALLGAGAVPRVPGRRLLGRVGRVSFACCDSYGGAVGKLVPSRDHLAHPVRVEGPLDGVPGVLPELLLVAHCLWRRPEGDVVRFYAEQRPDLVAAARELPTPDEGGSLPGVYAAVRARGLEPPRSVSPTGT